MPDSYRTELRDIIERVYVADLGGRATQRMVHEGVWADLPEHLVDYLIGKGIASEVQSFFRTKTGDGLPTYPQINEDGEHRQLALLTVDEFSFVHARYLDRAEANANQADKVRELCLKRHGVDLRTGVVSA